MIEDLVYATVLLFFIFDPFTTLPVFLSMTKGSDQRSKARSADRAVLVATLLFVIFVLIGRAILQVFDLSISSFRVAGGIILFLLAIEIIFNLQLGKQDEGSVAWVVIASPLLTGPGAMTTAILLADESGYLLAIAACVPALVVTWILLRKASLILKILGSNAIEIISRIIGLLLAAMAVEFVMRGVTEYLMENGVLLLLP